ncbi:HEPN domain-containing protein [Amycolatopsis sp. lyj-346]|uniref:ApeA N-terminal domain 1-containing protein n=1 Tax=Amycolatopsis sp. lyj-346 TaxID=2789289 RepID=UPI00397C53B1
MPLELDSQHWGDFWLADAPERRLPGVLDLSTGRPTVTIRGQLTPWVPAREESFTIHGELTVGGLRKVTILDAFTKSRRTNGIHHPHSTDGMLNGTHEISGAWTIRGCHVSPGDVIEYASIQFTHLDRWVDDDGLTDLTNHSEEPLILEYRQPASKSVDILEGRGTVKTEFQSPILPLVGREIHMKHRAWLSFTDLKVDSLSILLESIILPTLSLMTIMVGRKCELTELDVSFKPHGKRSSVHHPTIKPDAEQPEIDPGFEFLLLSDIGIESVANWIAKAADFAPIPNIIYSTFGTNDDQAIESLVLQLAACAEGFDRRKYGDKKVIPRSRVRRARSIAVKSIEDELGNEIANRAREALGQFDRSTFPERLNRLIRLTEGALPGITGREAEWIQRVKNARNGYAHMLDGVGEEWEVSYALFHSLRWMQMDYKQLRQISSRLAPTIYP